MEVLAGEPDFEVEMVSTSLASHSRSLRNLKPPHRRPTVGARLQVPLRLFQSVLELSTANRACPPRFDLQDFGRHRRWLCGRRPVCRPGREEGLRRSGERSESRQRRGARRQCQAEQGTSSSLPFLLVAPPYLSCSRSCRALRSRETSGHGTKTAATLSGNLSCACGTTRSRSTSRPSRPANGHVAHGQNARRDPPPQNRPHPTTPTRPPQHLHQSRKRPSRALSRLRPMHQLRQQGSCDGYRTTTS